MYSQVQNIHSLQIVGYSSHISISDGRAKFGSLRKIGHSLRRLERANLGDAESRSMVQKRKADGPEKNERDIHR